MRHARFALLSTAHVNRRVIPAIRSSPRAVLAAVGSRDLARAQAYAAKWDIPRAHGSYEELLSDPNVDVVYNALPNALHVEWTLRAIAAGKHVLCEKPLALEPGDVDRIADAAQRRGVVVTEAFMYRHEPLTDRVLELLARDAIGPLRAVHVGFTYRRTREADVRLSAALGGGCLWDIGCYAVSYARLVARREPVEVFGWAAFAASADVGSPSGPTKQHSLAVREANRGSEPGRSFARRPAETGVDETFTGVLRFPGDLAATIYVSFHAEYRTWIDIVGADATMRIAAPFKPSPEETIELRRGDLAQWIRVEGSPELFVREIDDIVGAVLDGHPVRVSLEESRGNAATLAALYESAQGGRPVPVRGVRL